MNMETKQNKDNSKLSVHSSNDLIFVEKEKEPCADCDKKPEVTITTENWTLQELTNAMPLLDKYGLSREEQQYIYNLYNRIFKTNKQPGCGKCLVNAIKQLKVKFNQLTNI
jgi:hypothetical protein